MVGQGKFVYLSQSKIKKNIEYGWVRIKLLM